MELCKTFCIFAIVIPVTFMFVINSEFDVLVLQDTNAQDSKDRAEYLKPFPSLTEFTLCYRISPLRLHKVVTVFSYSKQQGDNELKLDYSAGNWNVRMFYSVLLRGRMDTGIIPLRWQSFCISISMEQTNKEQVDMTYTMVKDGTILKQGMSKIPMDRNYIKSGGTVLLGQDQDIQKDDYKIERSFGGKICHLFFWDEAFNGDVLLNITNFEPVAVKDPFMSLDSKLWQLHGSAFWTKMTEDEFRPILSHGFLKFVPVSLTYKQHDYLCKVFGGVLGVPKTDFENQKIVNDSAPWISNCSRNGFGFISWLGISDHDHEGKWLTLNGEQITYTNWAKNEPNGILRENCAAIVDYSHNVGQWYDIACNAGKTCSTCRLSQAPVLRIRGVCVETANIDSHYVISLYPGKYIEYFGFSKTDIIYLNNASFSLNNGNKTIAILENNSSLISPLGRNTWVYFKESKNGDLTKETVMLTFSACTDDQFTCSDGLCVPLEERCNHHISCIDGSDEEQCGILGKVGAFHMAIIPPSLPLTESEALYVADYSYHLKTEDVPLFIYVSIDISRVASISVRHMEVNLEFLLTLQWRDSRLEFYNLAEKEDMNIIQVFNCVKCKKLWIPKIDFANGRGNTHTKMDEDTIIVIERKGEGRLAGQSSTYENIIYSGKDNPIKMKKKYNVTFTCPMDLLSYPFDKQICKIVFESTSASEENLILRFLEGGTTYSGSLQLTEYEISKVYLLKTDDQLSHDHYADKTLISFAGLDSPGMDRPTSLSNNSRSSYSRHIVIIELRRLFHAYLFRTFIPTCLMVIIAYLTFFFSMDDFNDRIMVSLTSLLVLTSLFNQFSSVLPKTSYLKLVDVWFIASIIFIFFIIVIQTILDRLRKDKIKVIIPNFDTSEDITSLQPVTSYLQTKTKRLRKFNTWMESRKIQSTSNAWLRLRRKTRKQKIPPQYVKGVISEKAKFKDLKWLQFSEWSKMSLLVGFGLFQLFYWIFAMKEYYSSDNI